MRLRRHVVPWYRQTLLTTQILYFTPQSLCDFPAEVLVLIYQHLEPVDHIMMSLCNKKLARIAMSLMSPVVLPSRHAMAYPTYKQHMDILVRLRAAVPKGYEICWYCGLYKMSLFAADCPVRVIKLRNSLATRARFCNDCFSRPLSTPRVINFYRLSWLRGDKRERVDFTKEARWVVDRQRKRNGGEGARPDVV